MLEATLAYGVSRQTLMQRVKRGELRAVHVRTGRRKGLRIQPPAPTRQPVLIMTISERSSVTMHPRTPDVQIDHPVGSPAPLPARRTASNALRPGR